MSMLLNNHHQNALILIQLIIQLTSLSYPVLFSPYSIIRHPVHNDPPTPLPFFSPSACFQRYIHRYSENIQSLYLTMTAQPSIPLSSYPQSPFFATHPPLTNPLQVEQFHKSSFWNSQFPDFVFEKEIAVTESSLVWLGSYRNSCERVALKITDRFQTESSEKEHQNKENQFVKEHQLNCMVRVKEVAYNEEYRIMVMHYYPWDLQQVFTAFTASKARKYTQEHFLFIVHVFRSIIEAVSELHTAGFIHRDLKPDNILIDQDFKIILSDFGLVTQELEVDTSSSGTLEYLAPERLSKKRRQSPIKRSVDIWSLGIILYELFTGENPFNGDSQDEILQEICEGYIRSKEIPIEAMSLINGILDANSEKRLTLQEIKQHPFLQREVDQLVLKNAVHSYL